MIPMNRKRNVGLYVLLTILLVGICFAVVSPPVGSKFPKWKPVLVGNGQIFPKREVQEAFSFQVDHVEKEGDVSSGGGKYARVYARVENRGTEDRLFQRPSYSVEYLHFGRWFCVFYFLATMEGGGEQALCPAGGSCTACFLVPEEVLEQPGTYRIYAEGMGSFTFTP